MKPRVTFDPESGYSYIYLGEPQVNIVKRSIPLAIDEEGAHVDLVLDFDSDGRLFGIGVTGPAEATLRRGLLDGAETHPSRTEQ